MVDHPPASSRGEKRDAENMNNDGEMNDWLQELLRIPSESQHTVLILENDLVNELPDDMLEIFSPPRILTIARREGLRGKWSIDRKVEISPGEKWDLLKPSHQKECLRIISQAKPDLIIGSPPCSWFSRIMQINWPRIPRHRRRRMMREARAYLEFSAKIYEDQHRKGKVFLHEHPTSAESWAEPAIAKLLKIPQVRRYNLDMCQFGLQNSRCVHMVMLRGSSIM